LPDERMDKPEDPDEPGRADTPDAKPQARGESVEDIEREGDGIERGEYVEREVEDDDRVQASDN
jgi:hypothetical protein